MHEVSIRVRSSMRLPTGIQAHAYPRFVVHLGNDSTKLSKGGANHIA